MRGNSRDIFLGFWFAFCGFLCFLWPFSSSVHAEAPVASYLFPPGGQRGTEVNVRVGGLFLGKRCSVEMLGRGVEATPELRRTRTTWFEGPLLQLPESQQQEDYPRDMAGRVRIAADAPLGDRGCRVWTAQGAAPALRFVVGDLPEVVEDETDGDPVPVPVTLPVTINGRIFPREDVDLWSFAARKGQTIAAEVYAARLGSPLDSRLEVHDPHGRSLAENDDAFGADSFLRFTAPEDGTYQIKIHDVNFHGGQAYVYRLTLTAGPHVDRAYPLGGRRATATPFALSGQGLPPGPVEIALPADAAPDFTHRLTVDGKQTNPFRLDVDDLPEYLESEPNDDASHARTVPLPAMVNGRVDRPGDVDFWGVPLHKGEACAFELRAARLGSPLQGVLAVCDAAGKELARAESDGSSDPRLAFTAPAEGTYLLRVGDRFHSRGGPDFAYRLRLDHPPAPDYRLQLGADVVTVPRGGQAKLKVQAERVGGFAGPIALRIEGLPAGVTAAPAAIPANQNAVEVAFKAEAAATVRGGRVTVRGSAGVGDHDVARTAALPMKGPLAGASGLSGPLASASGLCGGEGDSVLLVVALPTLFKIAGDYDMRWAARGTVHHRHYRLERNGYDGPVEVSLADRQARHLQGVTGPTITVPAGANEFDYPVQLPPWMETGRTCRVCVMGVGVVKDADGSEHEVSYSSVQQNEQVIAVVEPGRLGVETDRTVLLVEPGKTVAVPVRVQRGKGLAGPVKLELVVAAHLHGIRAAPVEVPAGRDRADLTVAFAVDARGPFNMPLTLRATVLDRGQPVVAETSVELLAGH
jgi:hypothetical protein